MDDRQIIGLYWARSENAIRETERKYGKLCLHIANHILANEADAEECVNDTYMSLWNAIPPEEPKNLTAFISRITRNIALNRLPYQTAQKRSAQLQISLSELEAVLPDDRCRPEVSREQLGALLRDFLRREAPDSRRVFIRKYFFFDSIADIAQRYAFSESKVKSMLYHCRHRLKKYLEKEGIYL